MREADQHFDRAAAAGQLRTLTVQHSERLTRIAFADFDVAPTELLADAGAEGFRDGFLRGKPCREVQLRIFHAPAISDLVRQKTPVDEPLAKFFQRVANARGLHDVNA